MRDWNILNDTENATTDQLIELLLDNRGIKTKKDKENFLDPKLEDLTVENVGIDKKNLMKAIKRIKKAMDHNEQIVVFGDYDVDGITGSAILWEVLHGMGAKILPYIPNRVDEGYGLSELGIKNAQIKIPDIKLIITVDNGIVADKAVDFANTQGIDVIITDHHVASDKLPKAHAIVHTTKLCGAGVAYLLSKEILKECKILNTKYEIQDTHLELAALGTVADMVPLNGANRTIVKHGIKNLCNSKRPGLRELYKQAGCEKDIFGVYEIGFIIAPRLNAAGRIESAMDSLRLLCTKDSTRARMLAQKLEEINKERQNILKKSADHAKNKIKNLHSASSGREKSKIKKLLFVADESYQQGIIGLVAGKLVEEFYRPSIVVSIGEKKSKGSARSISGFNIIKFLRMHAEFLPAVGGHPMAAGFSVETEKLPALQKALEEAADKIVTIEMLQRVLKIDCELMFSRINTSLHEEIQKLAPFGMGNPEPTFVSRGVEVKDFKLLGKERNHLKLVLTQRHSGDERNEDSRIPASPAGRSNVSDPGQAPITSGSRQVGTRMTDSIDAIGFGFGEYAKTLKPNDTIDIAYTIDSNTWNGNTKLQLKIRDLKIND